MSLAQGFPSTFNDTQGTNEVLHNLDNETKKIYNDVNAIMAADGHSHTGNGSDGALLSVLGLSGGTLTGVLNEHLGAPIASASTINLTTATGNFLHITGTTTITAVTLGAGMRREVIFDGVLTLTHHATNNNLPGAADITTATGDRASYCSDGTTVYCKYYQRANGSPVTEISSEILQLRISNNVTTPNAKMDITANNVPLYNSAYYVKNSGVISLVADLGASGANGLDTGTKSNSTDYYLWIIWKIDGTVASLWSLSSTSPTMPSGYVYKRRISWNRTDSSGNIKRILQVGKKARYVITAGSNTASLQVMASGASGSVSSSSFSWIAVNVSSFIPSTATVIKLLLNNYAAANVAVAPNNSFTGGTSSTTTPALILLPTSPNQVPYNIDCLLESTNVYWASNGNAYLYCLGWEDDI